MNFGDFLDNNNSCFGGGARVVNDTRYSKSKIHNNDNIAISSAFTTPVTSNNNMSTGVLVQSLTTTTMPMFNSSAGLSLALQTSMEGQGVVIKMGDNNYDRSSNNNNNSNNNVITMSGKRTCRDEDHKSRSGSANMYGASGNDDDQLDDPNDDGNKPSKKKRYHRHTPRQIQELEALFKECPHPDEKQRLELSKRLCLETRQVKFWFQNRRTQMKTHLERHDNSILRQENDKLRAENMSIREAMRNPVCTNCGGQALIGEISIEAQHLRIENARLKEELDHICALAGKFLGRPLSLNSTLELGFGGGLTNPMSSSLPLDFTDGISSSMPLVTRDPVAATTNVSPLVMERSMYLELALAAVDELVKMARSDEPLWFRSFEVGREMLNREEYLKSFSTNNGMRPNGFVTEASRDTGMVIINSLALVETLMDPNKWAEMFPCIIARTSTTDVISGGVGGTRNGALQLMNAAIQVISPLVPVREVNFLRFCKQLGDGVWAVVDVSIDDAVREVSGGTTFPSCRKLPSGCVVQDMPNGYSKVTWVEHIEYDESVVHQLYRPMVSTGMAFGAQRWVATLQRQCECLAILMSSNTTAIDHSEITPSGRRSMLKLAQRMTNNFCSGICALSSHHQWKKLRATNVDEDVQVMTRNSLNDPGEPPGIVLSAATSVWLPVPPHRLFDFLRDEWSRSEWDILSNGGPMQEMARIAKGQDRGNCVSLLRASAMKSSESSMLILQETCIDASSALVVYAPVDIPAMHAVMNGGDSAYVALLPSGFSIVPDGPGSQVPSTNAARASGSLLTVGFQIVVNSLPTTKLTVESVETVNNLISCTVQKIKAALQCENCIY